MLAITSSCDLDASKPSSAFNSGENNPGERKRRIFAALREAGVQTALIPLTAKPFTLELAGLVHPESMCALFRAGFEDYTKVMSESIMEDWARVNPATGRMGVVPCLRLPHDGVHRAGDTVFSRLAFHAQDTDTPLTESTYDALRGDMAVLAKAVEHVRVVRGAAYALTTMPGHHSTPDTYGGYCFVNNAAVAARLLQLRNGHHKVAVLDIDYHAGNGTISCFWEDPGVFVASIHMDPAKDFPFCAGFADQTGHPDKAPGSTLCLPLAPGTTWAEYAPALDAALGAISAFGAEALVVSLGMDALVGDPETMPGAGMALIPADFGQAGAQVAALRLPTVIVQEGGYDLAALPAAAVAFVAAFPTTA